jgi:hypothetical protein
MADFWPLEVKRLQQPTVDVLTPIIGGHPDLPAPLDHDQAGRTGGSVFTKFGVPST